ncbi:nuclease-related domain-containing protein [Natronoglycomyces albus]|uniref:nuclease-related domain-containing protein n=1 Tax=Natronoglycomyces albus TaxID=2811108 RepID=UPI001FE7973A|nr:nuclease-related domain-containing protein [Natronoglycomyces albus]
MKRSRGRWRVLHGVELGFRSGDIDHLLIGPYGVFTVNTKHHPGKLVSLGRGGVFVHGHHRPYPVKARREADRVGSALRAKVGQPVSVIPLVVIHGHKNRLRGWWWRRPLGVAVVPSRWIRLFLWLRRRPILSSEEVDEVYAIARKSTTWAYA